MRAQMRTVEEIEIEETVKDPVWTRIAMSMAAGKPMSQLKAIDIQFVQQDEKIELVNELAAKAIKVERARVTDLEKRNAAIEARNAALEAKVEELAARLGVA